MDTHNPFKTSHAIVIGIDRYAAAPLGSAVNDARNIARVLEAKHGYKVTLLTDQEAKASDLRAALGVKLKERVQPDDRVLIYFAGHGIADDADENDVPQGFLVPQDARTNDPGSMAPMAWLHDTLCALPCRHLLLILDCCFDRPLKSSLRFRGATANRLHREQEFDLPLKMIFNPAFR